MASSSSEQQNTNSVLAICLFVCFFFVQRTITEEQVLEMESSYSALVLEYKVRVACLEKTFLRALHSISVSHRCRVQATREKLVDFKNELTQFEQVVQN